MGKSLADYNIEQSSSSDMKNIKWSQKKSIDAQKSKKKKKTTNNISPSNIIYTRDKAEPFAEKVFRVIENEKSKKKKTGKRSQTSSASNCKIEQGFRRPGR